MWILKDAADLLAHLRQQLALSARRLEDPSNRVKDSAFYRGEVSAYTHAVEVCEALVAGVEPKLPL